MVLSVHAFFLALEGLIRQLHCVPPTSVASERSFSKVGLITTNKLRNRFGLFIKSIEIGDYRLCSKRVRELLLVALNPTESVEEIAEDDLDQLFGMIVEASDSEDDTNLSNQANLILL